MCARTRAREHVLATLQHFSRYLSFKREHNDLLLLLLKQCVTEQLQLRRNRHRGGGGAVAAALAGVNDAERDELLMQPVKVNEAELIDKVRARAHCAPKHEHRAGTTHEHQHREYASIL